MLRERGNVSRLLCSEEAKRKEMCRAMLFADLTFLVVEVSLVSGHCFCFCFSQLLTCLQAYLEKEVCWDFSRNKTDGGNRKAKELKYSQDSLLMMSNRLWTPNAVETEVRT